MLCHNTFLEMNEPFAYFHFATFFVVVFLLNHASTTPSLQTSACPALGHGTFRAVRQEMCTEGHCHSNQETIPDWVGSSFARKKPLPKSITLVTKGVTYANLKTLIDEPLP